jgi:predicted short-subunit dehydrogenase-like oxidoreductase (DUF2520 family)
MAIGALTRYSRAVPRAVVIGVGRTGGALAFRLKRAGWPVSVVPASKTSVARARKLTLKLAKPADLAAAQVCILAVPDAAVHLVARQLAVGLKTAIIHCAGALPLDVLPERRRGSFHPLVAISDPKDPLEGHWAAIAASDKSVESLLKAMARALKMHALSVPEDRRPAYHAAAVMSAGLSMSLLDVAVEASGLPRKDIEPALLSLNQSALRGAARRGLAVSLTGPIVRGDVGVVRAHLEALLRPAQDPYRVLSLHMLALMRRRLPHGTAEALTQVLRQNAAV